MVGTRHDTPFVTVGTLSQYFRSFNYRARSIAVS